MARGGYPYRMGDSMAADGETQPTQAEYATRYTGVPQHPIFGYHIAKDRDGYHTDPYRPGYCFECGARWPCDVAFAAMNERQLYAIAAAAQIVSEAFIGVPNIPIRAYMALSRLDEALIAFDDYWTNEVAPRSYAPRQSRRPAHAGEEAIRELIKAAIEWHDTPDGSYAELTAEAMFGATLNSYRAELERIISDAEEAHTDGDAGNAEREEHS